MKTDKNIWTGNRDDLETLALEIAEVRSVLREVSQQLLRIDRRVRAALPSAGKSASIAPRERLDVNDVSALVSRLTERAREGRQIETELRHMTVKDELAVLARELGMTNTKLPPKDDLIRRISARIRQRASVAVGIREAAQKQGETVN